VAVDASLCIPWVITEADTPAARALLTEWERQRVRRLVPGLFTSEVNAALLKRVRRGMLDRNGASRALEALHRAVVVRPHDAALAARALEIADIFALYKAYDTLYLALAEREGCELWTGDERFYNLVRHAFPQVHWLHE